MICLHLKEGEGERHDEGQMIELMMEQMKVQRKVQRKNQMKERRYDIEVYGRVQGVGFRYAARNQARAFGLKGWVENRFDGSVFVVIQGEAASCNDFIGWCRQGPGYSWVERIEISERNSGPLKSFQIRH